MDPGQLRMQGFFPLRHKTTKQPSLSEDHYNQTRFDAWNKKKKHKVTNGNTESLENKKECCQLPLENFLTLNQCV